MSEPKYAMNQCGLCGRFTLLKNGMCGTCDWELNEAGNFGIMISSLYHIEHNALKCDHCHTNGATYRKGGKNYCDECWSKT